MKVLLMGEVVVKVLMVGVVEVVVDGDTVIVAELVLLGKLAAVVSVRSIVEVDSLGGTTMHSSMQGHSYCL